MPAGTLCAPALASEHVSFPMLLRVLWPRRRCEDAQRQRLAGYDREISHVTIDLELAGMVATRAHDTTVMAELSVQGRRNVHDEDKALELGSLTFRVRADGDQGNTGGKHNSGIVMDTVVMKGIHLKIQQQKFFMRLKRGTVSSNFISTTKP